jgi:hypothetical protein
MWRHVIWYLNANVSDEPIGSIFYLVSSCFEMVVPIYETTRRHTTENCSFHIHCHKNLKSDL